MSEHLDVVNLQLAACLPLLAPAFVREKLGLRGLHTFELFLGEHVVVVRSDDQC